MVPDGLPVGGLVVGVGVSVPEGKVGKAVGWVVVGMLVGTVVLDGLAVGGLVGGGGEGSGVCSVDGAGVKLGADELVGD